MINAQELQGQWNKIRGQVKEKWGQLTDDDLGTNSGVNIRAHQFRFDYGISRRVTFQNLIYIQNSLRRSGQYPNFFVPLGDFAPTTYRWQPQLVFTF